MEVVMMSKANKSLRRMIFWGSGFLFVMFAASLNVFAVSTIAGTIYDKQRNALPEIEVELLDDYYRVIPGGRTRTDGVGRYQFSNLSDGRYTVRVFAFRYDFQDQEIPIEVNTQNVRGGEGSGYFIQDFYLLPKKGGLRDAELSVVFAQEVPQDAKKLYDKGLDHLSNKRIKEGILELNEAVKVFPKYYLALHRLGRELFIMKKYQEAVLFFFKAAEVNPKSANSFYYLGLALSNLGKEYNKAAITSLNQSYFLAPSSIQVLYVLGKVERSEGRYEDAEKHLLQAKKLSKTSVPEIHKELAQLYGNDLKRYKEAADELELYLKASKASNEEEKKTKKTISELREKSKSQINKANYQAGQ